LMAKEKRFAVKLIPSAHGLGCPKTDMRLATTAEASVSADSPRPQDDRSPLPAKLLILKGQGTFRRQKVADSCSLTNKYLTSSPLAVTLASSRDT
jgi:hypothetical protein